MAERKWICTEDVDVTTGKIMTEEEPTTSKDFDTAIKRLFEKVCSKDRNVNPGPLIIRDLPLSFYVPPLSMHNIAPRTYVTVATPLYSLQIISIIGTWVHEDTEDYQRPEQLDEVTSEIAQLLNLKYWADFTEDQDFRMK